MRLDSVIAVPVGKKEEVKITSPKKEDFTTKFYVRTMNEFEKEIYEERISIMTICGDVPNEEAEKLAAKDIISLREYSGTSKAIVDMLGALELCNPKINIHEGLK